MFAKSVFFAIVKLWPSILVSVFFSFFVFSLLLSLVSFTRRLLQFYLSRSLCSIRHLFLVLATRVSCVDIGPTNCCRCSSENRRRRRDARLLTQQIYSRSRRTLYSATYHISVRNAVSLFALLSLSLSLFINWVAVILRTHARNSKTRTTAEKKKRWIVSSAAHNRMCPRSWFLSVADRREQKKASLTPSFSVATISS